LIPYQNRASSSGPTNQDLPPTGHLLSPYAALSADPVERHAGVANMNRKGTGARITRSLSCCRVSTSSSCRSSMISHSRSVRRATSVSSRSTITHPSRSGAAVSGRIRLEPRLVVRSSSRTVADPDRRGPPAPRRPNRPSRRPDPGAQEDCLAAARGRRHDRHPGRSAQMTP
jgi:hypothetical protein